mmetsp:Transcript_24486/g.61397  ORF Transcript_24486/g.61397 Transcript_24486/m.61397 type:complete len:169 (-) Transcript_24486:100-606(-)
MHIIVHQEADGRAFEFEMPASTTVGQLQQRLNDEHGAPADRQRLYFGDRRLRSDDLVALASAADGDQPEPSAFSSLWASIRGQSVEQSSASVEPESVPELVELSVVYELDGGACCECCCCYCVCRPCECIERCMCFFSGCDLQCNQCQYCCWRCYVCPTDDQKTEASM